MARLHIVLPDDLERELRRILPNKKGALSEFIAEAIKEKLERLKEQRSSE